METHMGFFKSQSARTAYGIWQFLSLYVIILFIFIFCYGRILITIRRQARLMAGHEASGSNTAQTQMDKMQSSVIKTMMLVSMVFSISWTPASVYSFVWYTHSNLKLNEIGFYIVTFMGYIYICTNPFIYATKFNPVKRVLQSLIQCQKITQPPENIELA